MRPLPTALQAAYDVTNKQWDAGYLSAQVDEHMAVTGQVTEQLPSTRWKASSRATC